MNKIDEKSIRHILSTATVSSPQDIVKELLDNSKDSNADNITIELVNQGLDEIIVIDNGPGISYQDLKILCKRGSTSKIDNTLQINKIETIGFRGQALSAISNICNLIIITKNKGEFNYVNYNQLGEIESSKPNQLFKRYEQMIISSISGTCVICTKIFQSDSQYIKRQSLLKNKTQFKYLTNLIESYICSSFHIDFVCFHSNSLGAQPTILYKTDDHIDKSNIPSQNANDLIKDMLFKRLENIYGKNKCQSLSSFMMRNDYSNIIGIVSKFVDSGSKITNTSITSTPIYCINGHVISKIKEIDEIIISLYSKYNKQSLPFRLLYITIPKGEYNLNVNEQKSGVNLLNKNEIVNLFKIEFEKFIENIQKERVEIECNSTMKLKQVFSQSTKKDSICNVEDKFNTTNYSSFLKPSVDPNYDDDAFTIDTKIKEVSTESNSIVNKACTNKNDIPLTIINPFSNTNKEKVEITKKVNHKLLNNIKMQEDIKNYKSILNNTYNLESSNEKILENDKSDHKEQQVTYYNNYNIIKKNSKFNKLSITNNLLKQTLNDSDSSFTKEDFKVLEVIGQFNKGFILTKKLNKLYIIDQHSADEKSNYENYLNTIKISKQKMFNPVIIDNNIVQPGYMYFIANNMNIFDKLGYNITFINNKYMINTFPTIHDYNCKLVDFQDICNKLMSKTEYNDDTIIISSQCLNYITSKSCRYSIMIGDSLQIKQMKNIVAKMGELASPWNCPHGRPTIRLIKHYEN